MWETGSIILTKMTNYVRIFRPLQGKICYEQSTVKYLTEAMSRLVCYIAVIADSWHKMYFSLWWWLFVNKSIEILRMVNGEMERSRNRFFKNKIFRISKLFQLSRYHGSKADPLDYHLHIAAYMYYFLYVPKWPLI